MAEGYILIHRDIENWEWFSDHITFKVFIHCILSANWKPGKFLGKTIPRGSFVTSAQKMADFLKLTRQQLRTALKKLQSTHEIVIKSTNRYTVITVVKYGNYQLQQDEDNQQITNNQPTNNQQITNKQPTNNQQITTIEKGNKEINKKESVERKKPHFVPPTLEELRDFITQKGYTVDPERFISYYESNGWKVGRNPMKDWRATVRSWHYRDKKSGGFTGGTAKGTPTQKDNYTGREYADDFYDGLYKQFGEDRTGGQAHGS